MPRINAIDPAAATGAARTLLDAVRSKFGMTPNSLRTFATAPAVLKGYLDLDDALSAGVLDSRFREQIALAVAQINGCEYLSCRTCGDWREGRTDVRDDHGEPHGAVARCPTGRRTQAVA